MNAPLASMETAFKALGDETRLRILGLLISGEVCVCHIHESLRISQSKASRHLAYLRRAGLVETRRQGVWIYYRLAESRDPVRRALVTALGRVETVRRDVDRLRKTCGC